MINLHYKKPPLSDRLCIGNRRHLNLPSSLSTGCMRCLKERDFIFLINLIKSNPPAGHGVQVSTPTLVLHSEPTWQVKILVLWCWWWKPERSFNQNKQNWWNWQAWTKFLMGYIKNWSRSQLFIYNNANELYSDVDFDWTHPALCNDAGCRQH